MMLSISQLEEAINRWRRLKPSESSSCALCREASELATLYALMILGSKSEIELNSLTDAQTSHLVQVLGPLDANQEPLVEQSKAA